MLTLVAMVWPGRAVQVVAATRGVRATATIYTLDGPANSTRRTTLSTQATRTGSPVEVFAFWMARTAQAWDVDSAGVVALEGPYAREQHFPYDRLYLATRDQWARARVGEPRTDQTYAWDYYLDAPVWPLVLVRAPKPVSPWEGWSYFLEGADIITLVDLTLVEPEHILVFGLDGGRLTASALPRNVTRETDLDPRPPGRWTQRDTMAWPNTQPFRVLPTTRHWYFLTADGKLWHTPREGEPSREVKEVWAAGERKILGTIIDHDLSRGFVFGDGWYLDLGDEMKTVTEPADKPWPRPAADAPEIERLRVWRGWVPAEPAPAVGAGG